ncbi:transmembrane protein 200C-like [Salmo trutta]|uniref:transmembrane protein 200C-like n=1 Tax=Salmo trutta TaxID=8032 RepID=UPI001130E9F9|nr:transmembrane protein 200C-like [Salmo trutta]
MIATGGLLRMNRRQDSQRSKNHAENQRKRKQAERKKKNDVVVVKGKLNLCSPPGLVAAVGVVVLMLGIAMAVLGYWPHEEHSQGYASRVSSGEERMRYFNSPLVSVTWSNNKDNNTANQTVGELTNQTVGELTNQTSVELTNQTSDVMNGSVPKPVSVSTSPRPPSGGFLSEFLDSYLYSDNLKVFGPLVMGIGIFLFICANAVLHENRDQKTKIINLRDIYSTVIDLHSTRTKDSSPINGLVNYVQSRGSVDINSGLFKPGEMLELGRSPWSSTTVSNHQEELGSGEQQYRRPSMAGRQRSWSRDNQTFTESVYSIYRDQKRRCSEQASYPRQRDSEQASYPRQWDSEQASYPRQRDSEQASYPRQWDSEQASYPRQRDSEQASYPRQAMMGMGSHLSLNSLSSPGGDQPQSARRCSLTMAVCRQGDRARRFSCTRLERSNSKGYIKLEAMDGDSFEVPDVVTSCVPDSNQEVVAEADQGKRERVTVTLGSSLTEL